MNLEEDSTEDKTEDQPPGQIPPQPPISYQIPSYYPSYSPFPGGYYPHPARPEKKKFLGLSVFAWVFIVLIILLSSFIGMAYLMVIWGDSQDEYVVEEFSSEVIIGEDGHYCHDLGWFYYDDIEITIDISSKDSSPFDVYIMNENQYTNAYSNDNVSTIAFSALYSKENINQITDTIELSFEESSSNVYLIVDNRNTPVTPSDAAPTGIITVDIDILVTASYSTFFD